LQLANPESESALRDIEPVEISNSQKSEPVEEILNAQEPDDIESTPTIAIVWDTRIFLTKTFWLTLDWTGYFVPL